jgi:hypothetical protein
MPFTPANVTGGEALGAIALTHGCTLQEVRRT